MLALPERVPEPHPEQVLSLEEILALSDWTRRYNAESLVESELATAGLDACEAQSAVRHLRFVAWAARTGRLFTGDMGTEPVTPPDRYPTCRCCRRRGPCPCLERGQVLLLCGRCPDCCPDETCPGGIAA